MPDNGWLSFISEITELLALHGVFALVAIFIFYQQRRASAILKEAEGTEDHAYYKKVHASVVAATYVLIAIMIPIWVYATFFHEPETVTEGFVTEMRNQPVRPVKQGDPPLVVQQITPERSDVRFYYNRDPLELPNSKYRLRWILLSDPDVRNLVFYFTHRYERVRQPDTRAPATAVASTSGPPAAASPPDHGRDTRRFKLPLDTMQVSPGEPIQLMYREHPKDAVGTVGTLHWIDDEGNASLIDWEDTKLAEDGAAESGPVTARSWFLASAYAQEAPFFKPDGSYDPAVGRVFRQRLGNFDLSSQLAVRRMLVDAGSRSFVFIADSLAAESDGSYDESTLIHNLAEIVEAIDESGTRVPHHLHREIAKALYEDGDYASAARHFDRLPDSALEEDEQFFQKAYAYHANGQYREALAYYDRFAERVSEASRKGIARLSMGNVYLVTERYELALEHYREALGLIPESSPDYRAMAHANLGIVYYEKGEYEEAVAPFRSALDLYTSEQTRNRAIAHSNLGDAYYKLGRLETAARNYRRALELDPGLAAPYNNLAYVNALLGVDLEEALELVDRALQLEPDNPNYMDTKGWVLHKLGLHAAAVKMLEEAVDRLPAASDRRLRAEILDHLEAARKAARSGRSGAGSWRN